MKKLLVLVIALAIISGAAFAADNQSASYVRMLSREAATDSIDIAYFNPAGTAFLEKGLHVQLNNQFVWLDYSHESVTLNEYESKNFIPLFPTGYAGYAGDSWAAFFSYTIPDGGGSLAFEDGIYAFEFLPPPLAGPGAITGSLEASSATHMFSLGGSYKLGDFISFSLVGNLSLAVTKTSIDVLTDSAGSAFVGTAETKQSGIGYGGTFGIHYRPMDSVNLAVTVESGQKISQDIKDSSGSNPNTQAFLEGYVGTAFTDADRPWRMRVGASYAFPFGLEVPVSFKYDFYKSMDSSLRNSYAIALALRYPLNDTIEISVGTSYDIDSIPSVEDYNPLNPDLSSVTIAGGVGWEIFENFKLDVGALYPFYFAEEASGANGFTKMDKQVFNLAVGVGYVF